MIRFNKTRNVKSPERKEGNAGIDFFIPEYSEDYILELCNFNHLDKNKILYNESILIYPHEKIIILGGLEALFDDNTVLTICNKGGVATKKGLSFTSQIIDSSYEGELFYGLINLGNDPQKIFFGEKIIQAVPLYFNNELIEVVQEDHNDFYKNHKSERGTGSRGSTNTI